MESRASNPLAPETDSMVVTPDGESVIDTKGAAHLETAAAKQKKNKDRKIWSILSIIMSVFPIVIWTICIAVGVGKDESSGGAVGWLLIIYYLSLGIPFAFFSILFGIIGLRTSLRRLATISLILKVLTIIAIILWWRLLHKY